MLGALAGTARAESLESLSGKARASVALVTILDSAGGEVGSGSGFFVTDDWLVTNHHVIADGERAQVALEGGRTAEVVGVLAQSETHDLAILKVKGGPYPPLRLSARAPEVGEQVAVIGSPLGLSTALSTGVVAAVRERGLAKEKLGREKPDPQLEAWGLQITAPISPGSSGSPILAATGDVIGVAVGNLVRGESLNFGVPVSHVHELMHEIERAGVVRPRPLHQSQLLRNLAISAAILLLLTVLLLVATRR
jgi:S1-C subfamily serine protease